MSAPRREAGRIAPRTIEGIEFPFAFDASRFARLTPHLVTLAVVALCAVGYAGRGLGIPLGAFFGGAGGAFVTLALVAALVVGAIVAMQRSAARSRSYVTSLRANDDGIYARLALGGDVVFVPWAAITWTRFTRTLVHLRYRQWREERELRFLVPWRRTVDVIGLKSFVLSKIRPSPEARAQAVAALESAMDGAGDDGLARFAFEGAALARVASEVAGLAGLGLGAIGVTAILGSILTLFIADGPRPEQAVAVAVCGSLAGLAAIFVGVALARSGRRRVDWLWAEDAGIELTLSAGHAREYALWTELRQVEFRRTELRFTIARPGYQPVRRVLTIAWGRAEEFVRLKNYFVERMEAARAVPDEERSA